jgi:hypothetical protein
VADDDRFVHYSTEVEELLERARALSPELQHRIRQAVSRRRDDARARQLIGGTEAEPVGSQLLDTLVAADGELESARVFDLLVLIDSGLAEPTR